MGYRPWGLKESDKTEATQLLAQFDLWKPNPLQRSCLENPTAEPGGLPSMGSHRVGHD